MRRTHRQHCHRDGFTLYELMVAMTIGTTVLMAATTLIQNAFHWTQTSHQRREDDQTVFRLAQQFREDVHRASDVQRSDDELTLDWKNGTVQYQIESRRVLRTATANESQRLPQRESFQWAIDRDCVFQEDPTTEQISLVVRTVMTLRGSDLIPWRTVSASPGLRNQHEQGEIAP